MDEKDMTLFFHSVLINTYAKIRETVKSKSDVIYIEKDSENEIIIRPIRDYPNFLFQISKPIEKGNNLVFSITRAPKNARSNNSEILNSDHKNLERVFNAWIELINKHLGKKPIHPNEDSIDQQYNQEFYDWFEIVEEDADSAPFDIKRQILIEHSLDIGIKALIEAGVKEDDPIINEAHSLKSKVGIYSKKQVIKVGRQLYIMLRKKGGVLTKKVYDIWEKEMIAMGFKELIKFLGNEALKLLP
ncbi:hypothetical protein [Flagellimonas aurea]|uniref:HPt domain-containing protein n=1 Tax=Flagellimonas aurea TaxID=2915619 RepID=A0ABS3G911_9FLAO|nr:hypothetical protein [Allomuricauda aurea]MBO0355906.1 hypothetical protein [Allomuricauda aurea]UBZ14563.1 hypothetical protein LDL77_02335 [Allomuricauda aquimarina]